MLRRASGSRDHDLDVYPRIEINALSTALDDGIIDFKPVGLGEVLGDSSCSTETGLALLLWLEHFKRTVRKACQPFGRELRLIRPSSLTFGWSSCRDVIQAAKLEIKTATLSASC